MQLKTFLQAALVAVSTLILTNAAQAQELPVAKAAPQLSEEQQMLNNLPESVRAQMRPGIRYTIGAKTNAGWETGLVKGNAGLKHFYWSPVTSMVQASPSQRTKVQATSAAPVQRKEFHYLKPQRAALPHNPACDMPLPRTAVAKALSPSRNSRDVSAKIAYKRPRTSEGVSGELISTDTQAKLYADYPSSNQNASGQLTHQDAYGKLLN
jgi:hypothetical protein